jgi:murein DD-endopeptidase MepM/ murein hydrolase activator NlpD
MSNDFYTLIVVPHAKARFRKFQVSLRWTKIGIGIAAAMSLAVLAMLIHYGRIRLQAHELGRLQVENQVLIKKTRDYEENMGKLQARVVSLQKTVDKLGVMAGIDPGNREANVGGAGGVSGAETTAPSLDPDFALRSIDRKVTELANRSETLETFYKDQKVLLASTPSIWPVRGYLSQRFGNGIDPFTGQRDFHPGIDVSTPTGTKIVAPADGVIITTAEKGGYGKSIIMDHGYGVITRYGHLSGYNVHPGQRVKRGDVIGFVGSTGRSTAPHLHYEVWVHDQAQNPIQFILDEYRSFG